MSFFARFERHAGLVERMADALGLELSEQQMMGRLSPEDAGAMVARCIGCARTDDCAAWLADGAADAAAPPSYCRNTGQFDSLRRRA